MLKKPINIKANLDTKEGNLTGGSSVDVNVGAYHGGASSSSSIGKDGVASEQSERSAIGSSLSSSHEHSESTGPGGISNHTHWGQVLPRAFLIEKPDVVMHTAT